MGNAAQRVELGVISAAAFESGERRGSEYGVKGVWYKVGVERYMNVWRLAARGAVNEEPDMRSVARPREGIFGELAPMGLAPGRASDLLSLAL